MATSAIDLAELFRAAGRRLTKAGQ